MKTFNNNFWTKGFNITFLILLILGSSSYQSKASHAVGAELSYIYLSPNTYEITFTFYRDCNGITPTNPMDIGISNDCGYASQTVYFNQLNIETPVETTCPTSITTCYGGPYYGLQKYIFRGIVTLAGPCNWQIGHGEPARTAALTTISGVGSDLLYVYCMIDNSSGQINNSPVFNNEPVIKYSLNQRLSIDNSVTDQENDSVTYELIVPRTGPNVSDTVTFLPGYSYTQPLIFNLPMSINAVTGLIEGQPVQADNSLYAVLIKEFRNGILIGQVERDMIVHVENSNNTIPDLTGFSGSGDFDLDIFANQSNCFQIITTDVNLANQTTIDINSSIPGLTYFVSGSNRETGNFCWNPSLSDTIGNPYCFTISVKDDNCPILGYQVRSYCLNVQLPVEIIETNLKSVSIYPNPFNSEINIITGFIEKSHLTIFDLQGRKIVSKTVNSVNSIHNFQDLEDGIYVISIASLETGQVVYQRIIKGK